MDVTHDVFRAIFEVTRGTRMNLWTTRSLVYLSLDIMVGVCHHSPQIKNCITMIVKSHHYPGLTGKQTLYRASRSPRVCLVRLQLTWGRATPNNIDTEPEPFPKLAASWSGPYI